MRLTPAHKELGYTNKNFLFDPKDWITDKRFRRNKDLGFPQSELWDLDYPIALFIYPRLKAFKDTVIGCPIYIYDVDKGECVESDKEKWRLEIDRMVRAFYLILIKNCETSEVILGEKEEEEDT